MKKLKLTLQTLLLALALWLPGAAWAQVSLQVISGPSENFLTWTTPPITNLAVAYYIVARSVNGYDYGTLGGNISANTPEYTDTGVTPGVTYYYLVQAYYESTNGAYFVTNSPGVLAIPLASGGYYAFINGRSGLALSSSNEVAVQQSYSSASQRWKLVSEGGQYFAILNPASGQVLSGPTTFAQLNVSSYTGASNQLWSFQVTNTFYQETNYFGSFSQATNSSYYLVKNALTGQVLDDFGASLANGNPVGQWVPDGGTNQNWLVSQPAPPALAGVTLANNGSTNQYIFSGQVNPNGLATTVICSVGTNTSYAVSITNVIPAGTTPGSFSYTISYPVDNATIHGQVTVQNAAGANSSGDLTIVVGPPTIQLGAVNVASVLQGNVSGQINPNNLPTTVVIQFGTGPSYGQSVTNTLSAANGYQPVANTFAFPAIVGTTSLYGLITASNAAGTNTSGPLVFIVGTPRFQSAGISVTTVSQANVGAVVSPNGMPTTVVMQFGTNTAYGQSVTNTFNSANGFQPLTNTFSDPVMAGLTLHALITMSNVDGIVNSGDLTYVLGPPLIQSALVTNDDRLPQAYVSGFINPNGLPTTVVMQFGTNIAYNMAATNSCITAQSFANTFVYPSQNIAVTLHAFITASNAAGITTSGDFTTSSLLFEQHAFVYQAVTGDAAWADLDNDGWLDLVCVGQNDPTFGEGFLNFNSGTNQTAFWAWNEQIPNGSRPGLAVGDFDNDNRPDLFFACAPSGPGPELGSGVVTIGNLGAVTGILFGSDTRATTYFQVLTNSSFMAYLNVQDASVAVGDFGHTGRQDALVSGYLYSSNNMNAGVGHYSLLCQNNLPAGRNIFTNIPSYGRFGQAMVPVNAGLPFIGVTAGISSGQAVLVAGDFDNDGFADLFALNFYNDSTGTPYAGFFHGDGNKNFTPTTNRFQLYPGTSGPQGSFIENASCVLADLNGDGYLDMVLSYGNQIGAGNIDQTTLSIWLNDGHGNLTNSGIVLPQLDFANLAVGDIFNHGRNDILMVGYINTGANIIQTVVLRNDGNGVFTPVVLGNFGSIGETGHGLALADYDNDGRLDFAMTGDTDFAGNDITSAFLPATYIIRNEMNIPSNAPPAAPPGLGTTVGNGTVKFHWGNATDDITPANLLTYNLRVGTNSLDTSVVSPIANVTTGWRKIAAPGNCGHVTNTLYRFPPGTYYWSVQAVDGGFKGGAWAAEQTFTITNPEPAVLALGNATAPGCLAYYLSGYFGQENYTNYQYQLALLNDSTNELTAALNTNMWNVSWPTRFKGYTLQQATNLAGPWNTNTPLIGTLNGEYSVLVTNSGVAMFFRLVQQ